MTFNGIKHADSSCQSVRSATRAMDLEDYKCAVCHDFCDEAVEEEKCGALMCAACAGPITHCPTCGAAQASPAMPNRAIRRIIGKLAIPCPFDGCTEVPLVPQRKLHAEQCGFAPLPCPHDGCDEVVQRQHHDVHASSCPYRPYTCGCGMVFAFHLRTAHVRGVCPVEPVECAACASTVERQALRQHSAECPKGLSMCDYELAGCSFTGAPVQLAAHHEIAREEHGRMALSAMQETVYTTVLRLQREVASLRTRLKGAETMRFDAVSFRKQAALQAHTRPITALGVAHCACCVAGMCLVWS